MEPELFATLATIIVLAAIFFVARGTRLNVWPGHKAILIQNGGIRVYSEGRHTYWGNPAVRHIFVGPESMWIPAQEIQTTDSLAARYSFALRHRIVDVEKSVANQAFSERGYAFSSDEALLPLYRFVQAEIRAAIMELSVTEIREKTAEVSQRIFDKVAPEFARYGRELEGLDLMDIQLPASLRNAQNQAEIERLKALSHLERARAEVASLRALANAAKMIEDNPNLAVLRKIQAIESLGSGSVSVDLEL